MDELKRALSGLVVMGIFLMGAALLTWPLVMLAGINVGYWQLFAIIWLIRFVRKLCVKDIDLDAILRKERG